MALSVRMTIHERPRSRFLGAGEAPVSVPGMPPPKPFRTCSGGDAGAKQERATRSPSTESYRDRRGRFRAPRPRNREGHLALKIHTLAQGTATVAAARDRRRERAAMLRESHAWKRAAEAIAGLIGFGQPTGNLS